MIRDKLFLISKSRQENVVRERTPVHSLRKETGMLKQLFDIVGKFREIRMNPRNMSIRGLAIGRQIGNQAFGAALAYAVFNELRLLAGKGEIHLHREIVWRGGQAGMPVHQTITAIDVDVVTALFGQFLRSFELIPAMVGLFYASVVFVL